MNYHYSHQSNWDAINQSNTQSNNQSNRFGWDMHVPSENNLLSNGQTIRYQSQANNQSINQSLPMNRSRLMNSHSFSHSINQPTNHWDHVDEPLSAFGSISRSVSRASCDHTYEPSINQSFNPSNNHSHNGYGGVHADSISLAHHSNSEEKELTWESFFVPDSESSLSNNQFNQINNPSINQSNNQSNNQSKNRFVNPFINQPNNQSNNQSISQSNNRTNNQINNQISQSNNQTRDKTNNQINSQTDHQLNHINNNDIVASNNQFNQMNNHRCTSNIPTIQYLNHLNQQSRQLLNNQTNNQTTSYTINQTINHQTINNQTNNQTNNNHINNTVHHFVHHQPSRPITSSSQPTLASPINQRQQSPQSISRSLNQSNNQSDNRTIAIIRPASESTSPSNDRTINQSTVQPTINQPNHDSTLGLSYTRVYNGETYWEYRLDGNRAVTMSVCHSIHQTISEPPVCTLATRHGNNVCPERLQFTSAKPQAFVPSELKIGHLNEQSNNQSNNQSDDNEKRVVTVYTISRDSLVIWKDFMKAHKPRSTRKRNLNQSNNQPLDPIQACCLMTIKYTVTQSSEATNDQLINQSINQPASQEIIHTVPTTWRTAAEFHKKNAQAQQSNDKSDDPSDDPPNSRPNHPAILQSKNQSNNRSNSRSNKQTRNQPQINQQNQMNKRQRLLHHHDPTDSEQFNIINRQQTINQRNDQVINHSINPSRSSSQIFNPNRSNSPIINQSLDRNQTNNPFMLQMIMYREDQTFVQPIGHPTSHTSYQHHQSVSHLREQPFRPSVNEMIDQSIHQPTNQPVYHSITPSTVLPPVSSVIDPEEHSINHAISSFENNPERYITELPTAAFVIDENQPINESITQSLNQSGRPSVRSVIVAMRVAWSTLTDRLARTEAIAYIRLALVDWRNRRAVRRMMNQPDYQSINLSNSVSINQSINEHPSHRRHLASSSDIHPLSISGLHLLGSNSDLNSLSPQHLITQQPINQSNNHLVGQSNNQTSNQSDNQAIDHLPLAPSTFPNGQTISQRYPTSTLSKFLSTIVCETIIINQHQHQLIVRSTGNLVFDCLVDVLVDHNSFESVNRLKWQEYWFSWRCSDPVCNGSMYQALYGNDHSIHESISRLHRSNNQSHDLWLGCHQLTGDCFYFDDLLPNIQTINRSDCVKLDRTSWSQVYNKRCNVLVNTSFKQSINQSVNRRNNNLQSGQWCRTPQPHPISTLHPDCLNHSINQSHDRPVNVQSHQNSQMFDHELSQFTQSFNRTINQSVKPRQFQRGNYDYHTVRSIDSNMRGPSPAPYQRAY